MSEPIIVVDRLTRQVSDATGTLTILHDISFTLNARESAAIVGASGSGKSTLLGLLAGLDVPTSGSVRMAGSDLFALSEDARAAVRAERVGFVFQSFQLLAHRTALENVMLPLELAGARVLIAGMMVPPNFGRKYEADFAKMYADVAAARHAALVPFIFKGIADRPDADDWFQADRIHPIAKAHPIILDNVWAQLKPLLKP